MIDAIEEIRAFAETADGRKWDASWYTHLESLINKIRIQSNEEDAERYLDMLMWSLVDSGSLSTYLSPSIGRAADALQRKRKRAFKTKRIATL